MRVGLKLGCAKVVASDRAGRPVILSHDFGAGRVVACVAQPEDAFAAESSDRPARERWARWYRGMLERVR